MVRKQRALQAGKEGVPLAVCGMFAFYPPVLPAGAEPLPARQLQPGGEFGIMRRQRRDKGRTLAQGNQRGEVTVAVFRVMAVVQLVLFARPDGAARQMVATGKVLAQGVKVVAAQVDVLQRRFVRLCLQDGEQFVVARVLPFALQAGE